MVPPFLVSVITNHNGLNVQCGLAPSQIVERSGHKWLNPASIRNSGWRVLGKTRKGLFRQFWQDVLLMA